MSRRAEDEKEDEEENYDGMRKKKLLQLLPHGEENYFTVWC